MANKIQRMAALQRQVDRLTERILVYQQQGDRLSNLRLVIVVFLGGATAVLFTLQVLYGWVALLVTTGIFVALVLAHRRLRASQRAHEYWRIIKSVHLARMRLEWDDIPLPPDQPTTRHMLDVDLDLKNLHQLVNTAVSRGGSARLREWLTPTNPDLMTITNRQARVNELVGRSLFRDKLTLRAMLAADDIQQGAEGQTLLTWLADDDAPGGTRNWFFVLAMLSAINISLLVLYFVFGVDVSGWLSFGFLVYALGFAWQYRRVVAIFDDALTIEAALRRLRAVLDHVEGWRYDRMPAVGSLVAPLLDQKPSGRLRDVTRILSGASLRGNPIFWLMLNALIPWDFYFGWRMEGLKDHLRQDLPLWLDVWHELEALSSLATFAYLNPSYTVPRIGGELPAVFDAVEIGHPLIPDEAREVNSFTLRDTGDIVIITGSNMSGKSSFLRTLGVNLCLAYAGGRVCATGLDAMIFRLFTSIRVTDSLDDGISYFYAEVRRLRALLDALRVEDAPPLFFLIDEIFRGTNNRERLIGSRSYIRALAQENGVGLVATHDLELAKLEDEDPRVRNMHFREDVIDGEMVFDYKLHPGPSPTTNALRIMEMEGLPVEQSPSEA